MDSRKEIRLDYFLMYSFCISFVFFIFRFIYLDLCFIFDK